MKNFYLVAAILGAVVPYLFFIDFFLANGIHLGGFISALFANGAAGGFTADLLISSAVFWGFMQNRGERKIIWFIGLNLTIGLSCALPAYLYYSYNQGAPQS